MSNDATSVSPPIIENGGYLPGCNSPFLSYCMICDQEIPKDPRGIPHFKRNILSAETQKTIGKPPDYSTNAGLYSVYCSIECKSQDYGLVSSNTPASSFNDSLRPDFANSQENYNTDQNYYNYSFSSSDIMSESNLYQSSQQRNSFCNLNIDLQPSSYPQVRSAANNLEVNHYPEDEFHNMISLPIFQNNIIEKSIPAESSSFNNNYYLSPFSVSSDSGLPHCSTSPASYAGANYKKFRSLSIGTRSPSHYLS